MDAYDQFNAMIEDARRIQGRIVAAGGMATKSRVEDELMPKYGVDRGLAHDVMNTIEYRNLKPIYPDPQEATVLTKTLKFDEEVLSVLRGMEWRDDGLLGVITQQLERKLYERVNKALEAMGGKWNRSAKGHVFQTDPRPSVEGLIESGTLQVERDGFFETPQAVVERMLMILPDVSDFDGYDWCEPSAGAGAIVVLLPDPDRALCIEKNRARADDLIKRGYRVECADFLTHTEPHGVFVMNPPFEEGQDMRHVMHAYSLLKPGGALVSVVGEGAFFRHDMAADNFRAFLRERNAYDEKLPPGAFKESGTSVSARLVVVQKPQDAAQPTPQPTKAVRQGKAKAGKKPAQEKTETPAAPSPVPDLPHTEPTPDSLISAPSLDGLRLIHRMGCITVKRDGTFIGYASWLSSARDVTGDEAVLPYLPDIQRALLGMRPTDTFTLAYDSKNHGFRFEKP